MPARENNAKAYEQGQIKARRRRRVWSTEAFCANVFWGDGSIKGQQLRGEIQTPKPQPRAESG